VRHLWIAKVRGRFSRWSGTILVPDGDWNSPSVDVVIDASSIETGLDARDNHLRAADFLDVKRYPDITFRTLRVTPPRDDIRQIIGELTIKGRAGEVTLFLEENGVTRDPWGNERAGYTATAAINRREFGIIGNPALDKLGVGIGERVEIECDVEAVRQATATVA
jgi:polyisoprenoid-binding protein YceI